jgi:hypothetical protein
MKKRLNFVLIVILTAMSIAVPIHADLSFYTKRSTWESAVNDAIVTENFNSVSPYILTEGVNSAGLIDIQLIGLSGPSEWNSINDGSGPLNINGSTFYQGGSNYSGADFINLLLPFTAKAFGGDFVSTHSADGLTLKVDGLQYEFSALLPAGVGTGFLGFVSTNSFSQVTLFDASKNETFGLDNVSFAAVPEPATICLLGLGALSLTRKKR